LSGPATTLASGPGTLEISSAPASARPIFRNGRFFCFLLLGIVVALGMYRDARFIFHSDIAVGQHGYYYLAQTQALLENGHLQERTWSPGFVYAAAGIARFTGHVIRTVEGLSIGLDFLVCLGIFVLIRIVTGSNWAGLLGVVICELSAQHLYYIAESNSAVFSIALLLWGGIFLLVGSGSVARYRWPYQILGVALLIAACVSDISTIVFVAAFGICDAIVQIRGKKTAHLDWALMLAFLVWLSPLAISRLPVRWVPQQVLDFISQRATWPLAGVAWPEKILLLGSAVILLVWKPSDDEGSKTRGQWLWSSCAMFGLVILLNPFLNFQPASQKVAAEVGNVCYLLVAVVVTGLVWQVSSSSRKIWAGVAVLPVIPLMAISFAGGIPIGLTDSYLAQRANLVEALRAHLTDIPSGVSVVASNDDSFVASYVLRVPSGTEIPPGTPPDRLMWLVRHVPSTMAAPSMILLTAQGDFATVLMPDRILRAELAHAKPTSRTMLESFNPHLLQITSPRPVSQPVGQLR
jgi:hypothetical protein